MAEGRDVVRVPDVFCAIGELARATAREPIEQVVICKGALNGDAEVTATAIRTVDPAIAILTIDETVEVSTDVPQVKNAQPSLGHVADSPQRSSSSDAAAKTPAPRDALVSPSIEDALPSACPVEPDVREHAAPAHDLPQDAPGDSDLLEALMNAAEGVRELALTLIRQHTGWNDLRLTDPASGDDNAAAPVTYAGQSFGTLTSGKAAKADLFLWADWLGRWMAIDHAYRRYRDLAYRDELTDAMNRRYFNEFLAACIKDAARQRRPVTLMVLDIDDFKVYNDTFGHAAGDEILCETVRLLTSVIRKGDRVCRIGGDEFAVIFADREGPREAGSHPPENVEQIAQRFQDQICRMKFPKLGADAPATLSVSAGLATYPWDGNTPQSLLDHADQLALQSKRRGKNAITLGPGAQQMCRPRGRDEVTE